MSDPVVVHLLGYPGTGKLTVGAALVAAGERTGRRFVLVDNHLTSLPILAVIGADGTSTPPPRAWELVHGVRELVHRAAVELVAHDRSFVFTNFVVESNPIGAATIDRVRRVADERSARYVPVLLHCEPDELLRRVVEAERRSRRKLVDPARALALVTGEVLVRPPELALELDVTELDPDSAASAILDHLDAGR